MAKRQQGLWSRVVNCLGRLARTRPRATPRASSPPPVAASALDGIDWSEFESRVGDGFRQRGYLVSEVGGGPTDSGVDFVLTKGNERFLVHCKQWRANEVGVAPLRDFYALFEARDAAGGFMVTSGVFTAEATSYAEGRHIWLIDGPKLADLMSSANEKTVPTIRRGPAVPFVVSAPFEVRACPQCGSPMVERVAQDGPQAGEMYLGCMRFPKCKGRLDL